MKSTTRFKQNKRGIECFNCKQPISSHDNFCSECGQVNDVQKLSLKQYFSEFFAGVFSFDNRLWRTLIPLLFKPGRVTKEYINGQRMKYVNPFKLYLHTTIIFFLIFGLLSLFNELKLESKSDLITDVEFEKDSIVKSKTDFLFVENQMKRSIDSLFISNKINSILRDTILSKDIKDISINKLLKNHSYRLYDSLQKRYDLDSLKSYQKFKTIYLKKTQDKFRSEKIDYTINNSVKESEEGIVFSSFFGTDFANKINAFSKLNNIPVSEALDSLGYERNWKNALIYNKTQEFKDIAKNRRTSQAFQNKFYSKTSIMLFFMLPIFTVFLYLLYIRHRINYTEHLIFVFNTQTVLFLYLLFGLILNKIFNTDLFSMLVLVVFTYYLYKALINFYNQGKWKTFFKLVIMMVFYFILSAFAIIGTGLLAVIA